MYVTGFLCGRQKQSKEKLLIHSFSIPTYLNWVNEREVGYTLDTSF